MRLARASVARQVSTRSSFIGPVGTALRLAARRHASPVALQQCRRWPAFDAGYARHYNESNSIDDLLSASAAWHSLVPDRQLADEAALRAAFKKLDLNGNGVIEAFELKQALLSGSMKDAAPELIASRVDAMMKFADTITPDGQIDFDEYKSIIKVGCTPQDGRKV